MAQVLVRSDKGIERRFGDVEEFTILEPVPTHFVGGGNIVVRQLVTQGDRSSLIKEDSHARGRIVSSGSGCGETLFRVAQNSRNLLARYAGEPLEKIIHPGSVFEVLEQRLNRYPGAFEHPCTADFPWISLNHWTLTPIKHDPNVPDEPFIGKFAFIQSNKCKTVNSIQFTLTTKIPLDRLGR